MSCRISAHNEKLPTIVITEPWVSVKPRYFVYFSKVIDREKSLRICQPISNIRKEDMSKKSRQRIRMMVQWLCDSAEWKRVYSKTDQKYYRFKINFITLTLPAMQFHTDKEIHEKVFKEFIAWWRRYEPNLLYIYKAETQENGNLHYHLTTNSFIHWKVLRMQWNHYVEKLGYVNEFYKRNSHRDPNSTDVHSVIHVRDLGNYLAKYLSESDDERRVPTIKLWDCSAALKQFKMPPLPMDDTIASELKSVKGRVLKIEIRDNVCVWLKWFDPNHLHKHPYLFNHYQQSLEPIKQISRGVRKICD